MKTNTRLIQIKADASQWWSSLSKEEQEHYIEQHPKSKYAVDAKKEKEQLPVTDQKTDKPIPKHHIHKHAHRIVKKHLKEFHNDQKEFFGRKMDEAGSPERRSIGQSIKAKAKGILHAMKHEAKEYHLASGALVKLGKREKLDHHDIKALKSVAFSLSTVIVPTALTGGLAGGLAHVVPHLISHFLVDFAAQNGAKAVAFASVETSGKAEDKAMQKFIEAFADYVEKADISKEDWKKMFAKAEADITKKADHKEKSSVQLSGGISQDAYDELKTPEKKEYLEQHPASKYAENDTSDNPMKDPDDSKDPEATQGAPKKNIVQKVKAKIDSLVQLHKDKVMAKNSEKKKKAAKALKENAKKILATIEKDFPDEYNDAVAALKHAKGDKKHKEYLENLQSKEKESEDSLDSGADFLGMDKKAKKKKSLFDDDDYDFFGHSKKTKSKSKSRSKEEGSIAKFLSRAVLIGGGTALFAGGGVGVLLALSYFAFNFMDTSVDFFKGLFGKKDEWSSVQLNATPDNDEDDKKKLQELLSKFADYLEDADLSEEDVKKISAQLEKDKTQETSKT